MTATARETILATLAPPAGSPQPRASAPQRVVEVAGLVGQFVERVGEYGAEVARVSEQELATTLHSAIGRLGVERVVVPAGLPVGWLPPGVGVLSDDGLSAAEVASADAALTGCALAVAETGTIVLDGLGLSGRRLLSLLPDRHVCVVRASQVVATVPMAIDALDPTRGPLTFVSGPSATSDIEFRRVEGVHGPRQLVVVLVDDSS